MMIWQLLAVLFGATTFAASAIAIWQHNERGRLQRRFAGVLDLDREIAARRHAFNVELSRRQIVFDSEIAARRRAIEGELAKQTAELEGRRRDPSAVPN
jgi:hypothetical protein